MASTTSTSDRQLIQHALILMAMRDEAQPIIEALALDEMGGLLDARLPMRCFQGAVDELAVSLVIAGVDDRYGVDNVGSEAATLMAYEAVSKLNPDLIISAGTAGGFAAKGAGIGTVYLSDEQFVFHDRHVPMPGFSESGDGHYPALATTQLARDLGLPFGVISTGSSLEKSDRDIRVITAHDAVAKEMEAAGIAWVAMLLGVPMMGLKSITNLVDLDNQSETEFVRNFAQASETLTRSIMDVLAYLRGKSLAELG